MGRAPKRPGRSPRRSATAWRNRRCDGADSPGRRTRPCRPSGRNGKRRRAGGARPRPGVPRSVLQGVPIRLRPRQRGASAPPSVPRQRRGAQGTVRVGGEFRPEGQWYAPRRPLGPLPPPGSHGPSAAERASGWLCLGAALAEWNRLGPDLKSREEAEANLVRVPRLARDCLEVKAWVDDWRAGKLAFGPFLAGAGPLTVVLRNASDCLGRCHQALVDLQAGPLPKADPAALRERQGVVAADREDRGAGAGVLAPPGARRLAGGTGLVRSDRARIARVRRLERRGPLGARRRPALVDRPGACGSAGRGPGRRRRSGLGGPGAGRGKAPGRARGRRVGRPRGGG